jgi:hypothetical protein
MQLNWGPGPALPAADVAAEASACMPCAAAAAALPVLEARVPVAAATAALCAGVADKGLCRCVACSAATADACGDTCIAAAGTPTTTPGTC